MLRAFAVLSLIMLACSAFAQDEYQNFGQAYSFSAGQSARIFADTANIRSSADAAAPVQDRLYQGIPVKILSVGAAYTLNHKMAPWCTVAYTMEGVRKTGVIWSGLLSPRTLEQDGVHFLYGMRFAPDDTSQTWVDVKAMKGDSVVARSGFYLASSESAGGLHKAHVGKAKGLAGFDCLLCFYYSGEACGIPTYEQYIGWTGKQLVVFPQLESSADAGAYASESSFVFPADKGGVHGMLLYKERSEEYNDNDKPIHQHTKTIRYKWDPASRTFRK